MNSKTTKAKYLKFAILIISVCFILGAISACLPFNISIPTLDNDTIDNTAMTITQNSSDNLGEFNDGYSYVYTDKTKIDDYRAGTEDYDITTHKVAKTSINRGTQDNPYVIATTADWEIFVKRMETDSTRGSGQYFVLGADIDFTGVTFHPVRFFNGTFYGMGHSIKNISCDTWQYYNNGTTLTDIASTTHGFGLICRTAGATITDLIVENFSYKEMPQTSRIETGSARVSHSGGIIGLATGDELVLNCHTSGEITKTASITDWMNVGGIVGGIYTFSATGKSICLYRCSSEFYVSINGTSSNNGPQAGGILGDAYNHDVNVTTYIYDCVSNVKVTTTSPHRYMGCIMGHNNFGSHYIENAIGTLDITSSPAQIAAGCLVAINRSSSVFSIKNCYVEGKVGASDTSKLSINAVCGSGKITSASNINVVKSTSSYAPNSTSAGDSLSNISGEPHEFASSNLLISQAKNDVGTYLPSQIWDESKIGGAYDPDNTPVRNYLLAFINFRNLNNNGDDEESVGLPDGAPYVVGDKLPDETSDVSAFTTYLNNKNNSNHEFLGWTDDPTGESEPFMELPSGYFGDVTLYAVWGLPDSYVNSNIKTSLSVDKNLIEYDSVASITLTAKVEHTAPSSGAMTNPKPTYYFAQDGEEKTTSANVKSNGVLSVKTVKDSGKYSFKYRLTDGLEPLWFYDGECVSSEEKTITIEKGKLEHMTLKDFKIS
ncbi:MAG: hypothetical protein K2O86_02540, partial [Clostridia bacterium]|nr:hypothetical protein [Clostridia bacterium]